MNKKVTKLLALLLILTLCAVPSAFGMTLTPIVKPNVTPLTPTVTPSLPNTEIVAPNLPKLMDSINLGIHFTYPKAGTVIKMSDRFCAQWTGDAYKNEENGYVFELSVDGGATFFVVGDYEEYKNFIMNPYSALLRLEKAVPTTKAILRAHRGDSPNTFYTSEKFTISSSELDLNTKAVASGKSVKISWEPYSGDPANMQYKIFRREAADPSFHLPLTDFAITETTYTDETVETGKAYVYRVEAHVYQPQDNKSYSLHSYKVSAPVMPSIKTILKFTIGSSTMYVNDVAQPLDAPPVITQGRTFVPLRALCEPMGWPVSWDATTQKITVTGTKTIELWIGNKTAMVNGVPVELDVPPYIANGRTLLPLRFVSANMKCTADWQSATQTVTITKTE